MVEWLNFLIFGESGVGKTYLSGEAEEIEGMCPVIFIDVEGGTTTIRHRQGIDVVRVKSMRELENVGNELFKDTSGYYKTAIVDSLTELQDLDMRVIMHTAYSERPDKVDIDVPSQREWGKSRSHIRKLVRHFRDLPMNTIMTALVIEEKEEGQPTKYFPSLPGKLRGEIPGFMDVVGYYYKETNGSRKLQFTGTRRVIAKDRTSKLGDAMVNPTMKEIWEKIHE